MRPHLIIERFNSSYFLIKCFFVHTSWIHLHVGAIAVTSTHHGRSQVARVGRAQVTRGNRWINRRSVESDHLKAFIVVRQILMNVLFASPEIYRKNFTV